VVRPYLCVTDKITEVWISTACIGHAKHAKLRGPGGMPPQENFENLPESERLSKKYFYFCDFFDKHLILRLLQILCQLPIEDGKHVLHKIFYNHV